MIDNLAVFALVFLSKLFPIRIRAVENRMTCTPLRVALACLSALTLSTALTAQETPPPPKPPPAVVAGIPVNYDEAKVGTYTLPDALVLDNGKPVRDAKTWTKKRRAEIVSIFETQQYGKAPGRPPTRILRCLR